MFNKPTIALTIISAIFLSGSANGATSNGDWILPDSKLTPGATNPAVTQSNIKQNICKSGWTDTVRPSVSYTNKLKVGQLANGYTYHNLTDPTIYEEDHLISLQLGGSPTDPKNLWPEPYPGMNAHRKDVIETKLKTMICAGKITLADAQKAISTNWVTAYNKYVKPADIKTANSNG